MPLTFSKQYFHATKNTKSIKSPNKQQEPIMNITCNRHVSFEESETVSLSLEKKPSTIKRKNSLKRPFSSMCLVELAGIVEPSPSTAAINGPTTNDTDHNSASCWDHFVDIIPPEECCYNYIDNDNGENNDNDNYFQTFFFNKSNNKSSVLSRTTPSSSSLEHSIKRLRIK